GRGGICRGGMGGGDKMPGPLLPLREKVRRRGADEGCAESQRSLRLRIKRCAPLIRPGFAGPPSPSGGEGHLLQALRTKGWNPGPFMLINRLAKCETLVDCDRFWRWKNDDQGDVPRWCSA